MPGAFRWIADFAATSTRWFGEIAIAVMLLHIALDILLRETLGDAPDGMPETVSRVYMVMAIFLPLAAIERRGEHIEVNALSERLPVLAQTAIHVFSRIVVMAVAGGMAALSFGTALAATMLGERIDLLEWALPIWPARWAFVIGFGALALSALSRALDACFQTHRPPA